MQENLTNHQRAENYSAVSLENLNDDCLECIFERINDSPAQIQVARTCKRFRYIMLRLWRRNPDNRILVLEHWTNILPHSEDLEYFLQAMRKEFHTVRLIDECLSVFLREMEEMGIKEIPGVERCELQDEIMECYPKDEDIESLTKLLPNLKYLSLNTPITGCFISKFEYLEELHLYAEYSKVFEMKPEFLNELLLNLRYLRVLDIRTFEVSKLTLTPDIAKCMVLQELKLNLNTLKTALDYVLMMPQLRHLKVLLDQDVDFSSILNVDSFDYKIYETKEFIHILEEKSSSIIGLAVDLYFMPLSLNWDFELKYLNCSKLKLLALCNCDYESNFFDRYTHMNQLEILCLRHASSLENDTVMKFLKACPQLQHLDISYCMQVNKSLLTAITEYLSQQERAHKLCIYYRMSGLEPEVERNSAYWSSQKYVRLCFDFPPNSDIGLSYVYRGFVFNFEPSIENSH
uniref:F-box domain-containing protein n=1 Tax=Glossina morsitans morsitans TaxID=37546 RepID=A0A1B0G157_GLOMM